ncbi:MAG TPA: hypothetical protein VEY33_04690 [Gemmatimonadota bacterium]|nr:hypothetical protein [Gemmatimonadota bacterium]
MLAGLALVPLIAVAACGGQANGTPQGADASGRGYVIEPLLPSELVLGGAVGSLEDLLRTVERGLAESDTSRLDELMIDEREFRDILFPAFPAAHPPINAGFDTVWILQYSDSYRGLRRLLREYGGRNVRILAVRFDRPGQDYVNFVLHETSRVDLTVDGRREEDGRLFGSVIQVGDQWKVLTYPDDPS